MIAKKDVEWIGSLEYGDQEEVIRLSVVERLKQELTDWCDHYRKSNDLWRKSQDENLDDFEDKIIQVFGVRLK